MAKRPLLKSLRLFNLLTILLLAGFVSLVVSVASYFEYRANSAHLFEETMSLRRERLTSDVRKVRLFAEQLLREEEQEIRSAIFYRVQEAIDIAYQIYEANNLRYDRQTVARMIADALRAVRYNHGQGYYFAVEQKSERFVLYPLQPEIEGRQINQLEPKIQQVVNGFADIVRQYGDGFMRYRWPKPGKAGGTDYDKIAFAKYFAPFDWYIGSGLYYADFTRVIEEQIIKNVELLNAGNNGFLLLDQQHQVKVGSSRNPTSNFQLLEAGIFHQIGDLLYYAETIQPLGWTIGIYSDISEVRQQIDQELGRIRRQAAGQIGLVMAATLLLSGALLLVYRQQNRRVHHNLATFGNTFRSAATSNRLIDLDALHYSELEELGVTVNRMIDENRQIKEGLAASREFLSLILNAVPALVFTLRDDLSITSHNSAAREFVAEFARLHASPLGTLLEKLAIGRAEIGQLLNSGLLLQRNAEKVELEGREYFFDVRVNRLGSIGKREAVVQIEDVSERVRMENMLIVSEKMMSIGGMAAGMAHEINNPLSIISQACGNLERRLSQELPANRKALAACGLEAEQLSAYVEARRLNKFVGDIQEGARRAAEIVRNMLSFSANSSSRIECFPVGKLFDDVLLLVRNDFELKKRFRLATVKLEAELATDLPELYANRIEIEQVLFNLIKNAVQAMMADGQATVDPQVRLRASRREHWLEIEVEDNGPGIEPQIQRRIFEPFFTTKEPGVGTGLGLAVSYFIVTKRHHGQFRVDSTLGKGTCFTLRLPLEVSDA